MKSLALMTMLAAAAAAMAAETTTAPRPAAAQRHVDLVICLDTSNSMDGLIESAKQKLWAVVGELATARPRPVLRVALYQYGNDGLNPENGWVQKLCDLTDDLDTVYGKLFALKTNGGTEYVARVVRAATQDLSWNMDKGTLRMIFVAGNEPATQDTKYSLQDICKAAASKGIVVNTIHCGAEAEGRNTGWADAAKWADGQYASIDQDRGTVVVATPYDKELADLGAKLNSTYVAYGAGGAAGAANQAAQDANATTVNAPAAAQRAAAKASTLYRNAGWDLVDAVAENKVDLAKVDAKELPEPMQKMTPEQRKAYVEQQAAERTKLQGQIRELNDKAEAFRKDEVAKKGLSEKDSFDNALRAAVRAQAEKMEFQFEEKKEK